MPPPPTPPDPPDAEAIRRVLVRYAEAVDTGRWALLDDVFAPDATVDYAAAGGPGPRADAAELDSWLAGTIGEVPVTQHHLTNHRISVDRPTARSRCYLHNPLADEDGAVFLVIGGVYDDRWRRTPSGWRITHRTHRLVWHRGEVPDGLGFGPLG